MNDVRIDNGERLYPIIVYRDITYVPMTYNDSRFLGLETKWEAATGLQVNKITSQTAYNPNRGFAGAYLENAVLPDFRIRVNGKEIDNNSEVYPLLVFRDITYFPLTWRYMVDEFGWTSSFDAANGLVISSKGTKPPVVPPVTPPVTPPAVAEKVYSQDFGSLSVIFDRTSVRSPGNLYVKENNVTKKVGNPYYIYGVGYLQAGTSGDYAAVDKVEYANRWIYTVAVDPSVTPAVSRNVRINVDTNEVQFLDNGTQSGTTTSGPVYSQQFGGVTVIFDRASNKTPGNLSVRENNVTKKVGNPNLIYGVGYLQTGSTGEFTPVDKVEFANRWVYTLAADPAVTPVVSRNVRINIDTNEVQALDGSAVGGAAPTENIQLSGQVYSRQFGAFTVILDRSSNRQPGNLYIKENNVTRRIGNPAYIYGVSYIRLGVLESYSPVDRLSMLDRWVYVLAINPAITPLTAKNVKVNIDTHEVQTVSAAP